MASNDFRNNPAIQETEVLCERCRLLDVGFCSYMIPLDF